jgi:hypothetical protein
MSLRQHPCAPAALEASGAQSGANLHLFILPQPQPPHDLRPGRITRTFGPRLVARRALSLRHADRRFRDLSPLRGLRRGDFGFVDGAVRGGKRELPRRPRTFHSASSDARVPGRDARGPNLSTHCQLDACRGAALACRDIRKSRSEGRFSAAPRRYCQAACSMEQELALKLQDASRTSRSARNNPIARAQDGASERE